MSNHLVIPEQAFRQRLIIEACTTFPNIDPLPMSQGLAISQFTSHFMDFSDAHFSRYQLTQPKFLLVLSVYLTKNQEWTPAVIAEMLGVTRATVTGLLDGLEKDDWIVRVKNPDDKRSVTIELSEEGERKAHLILPDHFMHVMKIFSIFSDEELSTFASLSSRLGAHLNSIEQAPLIPGAEAVELSLAKG